MKRMIIRIALVLALSIAVVEPIAMTQTTEVAQAKTYTKKKVKSIYKKLKKGISKKKVKKILGKSLGSPIYESEVSGAMWREYSIDYKTGKYTSVNIHVIIWGGYLESKSWLAWG
jgi:hypothetical protein